MNDNPTEQELGLAQAIREFVASITPPGTRLLTDFRNPFWGTDLTVCCDGAEADFGYLCGLSPGHPGRCHTFNKNVDFQPTAPGQAATKYLRKNWKKKEA